MIDELFKVKIVGYTQPAKEFQEDFHTVQDMIAYCARVSNPSNQFNTATSDKLIQYLAKHQHWSPFEMASVTMEIETTRDIARQILRHRSAYFQEFSQRYSDPTKEMKFVIREARLQDTKNRQNSIETNDPILQAEWAARQQDVINLAVENYKWAIENGIAKEQARCVLPEGNTPSRMYMHGTIRTFIHYCAVRTENGTQLEHRLIAKEIASLISTIFPSILLT